jgi:hypothetical protein
MADSTRPSDPAQQEPLVNRHPRRQDPTRLDEERTSDNSTVDNGGIGSGAREDRRRENPTMPGDDATLRTEI